MRRPLGLLLSLLAAIPVLADTIVLKNGRRIVGSNVVDEGDKVSFETSAGRMSLPKSIVARVEKGGAEIYGAAQKAAQLDVAPPRVDPGASRISNYDELASAVIHDGAVDTAYLAKLDAQAQSGSTAAVSRAVAGHNLAAEFLLNKGESDPAIEQCRAALALAPQNLPSLLNVSYLHLRRSEFTTALDFLERARRVAPDSADVAKLTGWAYYGLNKMDEAVAEWKRALSFGPDPDVQRALDKAERDQKAEAGYREGVTAHFTLRYSGAANPQLAAQILRTLEGEFDEIQSALNFSPRESIGVILYTQEAFTDVTRAPGWVGALNDGRLRIPVEGLDSVTPELARVLKHELTHSFVYQKTLGRANHWLQEGIAQWMEGRRSSEDADALVQAYDALAKQGSLPILARLEGPWQAMPEDIVRFAYAWSLAAVEYVVDSGGSGDLERLLDRVASDSSTEAALREALHSDYADLEKQTADYLRRTYVH